MAAYIKYHCFAEDLAEKKHNLASDVLKVALTNTAPIPGTHAVLADIAEIAAGFGYTAGGNQAVQASSAQTGGVYALSLNDPAAWLAAGGNIGPLRYAVLYNSTVVGGPLIASWDYGNNITLVDGETLTVDFSAQTLTLT